MSLISRIASSVEWSCYYVDSENLMTGNLKACPDERVGEYATGRSSVYLLWLSYLWTCKAQKQAIVQWDCNVFQSNATKHIRHIVLTIVTWHDPTSSSPLNHFNLHNVLASITVPYWWEVFNCRPRGSVEQYFKFRMRNPIVLFAFFVFFLHMIVPPKIFWKIYPKILGSIYCLKEAAMKLWSVQLKMKGSSRL